jgi:hypothetical protein
MDQSALNVFGQSVSEETCIVVKLQTEKIIISFISVQVLRKNSDIIKYAYVAYSFSLSFIFFQRHFKTSE